MAVQELRSLTGKEKMASLWPIKFFVSLKQLYEKSAPRLESSV